MSLELIQNCTYSVLPVCQYYKDKIDFNTGYIPLYNGCGATKKIVATLTNYGSSYGYRSNNGDSYYVGDGVDDYGILTHDNTFNGTAVKIFSFWTKWNGAAATQNIIGQRVDSTTYWRVFIDGTGHVQYQLYIGSIDKRVSTVNALTSGANTHVMAILKNGVFKIYINGVEATYSRNDAFSGSYTFTDTILFNYLASGGGVTSEVRGLTLYEYDVESLVADLYNAGPDLNGLRGIPQEDGTMLLEVPINYTENKYFRFSKTFASWSKRLLRLQ